MLPTLEQLRRMSKAKWTPAIEANAASLLRGLTLYGSLPDVGLDLPHRLDHFLCQLMHESGGFKYDEEIASGKAYEGRKDLGNTQTGDGVKFKGRGPIQLTGRDNYTKFTKWAKTIDASAPDFTKEPDAVLQDPWEGLAPIWFWTKGNQTGKSLNRYADNNDIEMITRKINGGVNGLEDRLGYYTRCGLVLLGYGPSEIEKFQKWAKSRGHYDGEVDGEDGPRTRAAIHKALAYRVASAIAGDPDINVNASPVTEIKEVAVAPKGVEKPQSDIMKLVGAAAAGGASSYVEPALGTFNAATPWIQGLLILVMVGLVCWLIFGRQLMAQRAQAIKADIKEVADAGLPS